jgi:hypothetical protein
MVSTKEKIMTIKKFLVALVAFVTVFLSQSQAWAAVNTADKVHQSITLEQKNFFAEESPAMLAAKMGSGGEKSMLWIASIFITGLGQILMGDVWRGLKFLLLEVGLVVASIILGIVLVGVAAAGAGSGNAAAVGAGFGLASIIGLVFLVAEVAVHIWNIIDAYNMAQEGAGMSKIQSNELANLQKQLDATVAMANSIKLSQNGTVSFKALAF